MSWKHIKGARDMSKSQGSARCVLIVLATYANDDGICWPGIRTIARNSGFTRTTVGNAIRKLEALGEVTKGKRHISDTRGGRQQLNAYRLNLYEGGPAAGPPKVVQISPQGGPAAGTESPVKGGEAVKAEYLSDWQRPIEDGSTPFQEVLADVQLRRSR